MMKSILITGGCGNIGSNFADWLLENTEYHVIVVDNLTEGYLDNIDTSRVTFYLRNAQDDLNDIFEQYDVKYCYAMGNFAAEGFSPFVRKFAYENNVIVTANLINHCIKYGVKLIYLSSMSVYGEGQLPFVEAQVPDPIDPYGLAKFLGEKDVQIAGRQHGMKWAIIRPHNVIGRKVNLGSKYRNVLAIWVRQILNNEPVTMYGDGNQTRAFSWSADYAPVFLKVAENDYEDPIFNVGGDIHHTLNEVAELLFEVAQRPKNIVYLQERFEVRDAYCSHEKIKSVVGFDAKTNLREMLTELWEWARVQPHREVKEFENIELEEGLYEYWKPKP